MAGGPKHEEPEAAPALPDPDGQLAIELGVTGIPETFIVNPGGIITAHWIGPLTADTLEQLIAQASGPQSPA